MSNDSIPKKGIVKMQMQQHSRVADHNAAWRAAMRDLGITDILAVSREKFGECLRLATRILYFERNRRKGRETK